MTWIRTISQSEADEKLLQAIEGERSLYPKEYADPVHLDTVAATGLPSIVTMMLNGVVIQSWQLRGGGVKETT